LALLVPAAGLKRQRDTHTFRELLISTCSVVGHMPRIADKRAYSINNHLAVSQPPAPEWSSACEGMLGSFHGFIRVTYQLYTIKAKSPASFIKESGQ
jgi:hypothetical protein